MLKFLSALIAFIVLTIITIISLGLFLPAVLDVQNYFFPSLPVLSIFFLSYVLALGVWGFCIYTMDLWTGEVRGNSKEDLFDLILIEVNFISIHCQLIMIGILSLHAKKEEVGWFVCSPLMLGFIYSILLWIGVVFIRRLCFEKRKPLFYIGLLILISINLLNLSKSHDYLKQFRPSTISSK